MRSNCLRTAAWSRALRIGMAPLYLLAIATRPSGSRTSYRLTRVPCGRRLTPWDTSWQARCSRVSPPPDSASGMTRPRCPAYACPAAASSDRSRPIVSSDARPARASDVARNDLVRRQCHLHQKILDTSNPLSMEGARAMIQVTERARETVKNRLDELFEDPGVMLRIGHTDSGLGVFPDTEADDD